MDTPDLCIDDMALAVCDLRRRAHESQMAALRSRSGPHAAPSERLENVAGRMVMCDHLSAAHEACVALVDAHVAGEDVASHRRRVGRALRQLDRMQEIPQYAQGSPGAVVAWRVRCADLLALLYPGEDESSLPEQGFFADAM